MPGRERAPKTPRHGDQKAVASLRTVQTGTSMLNTGLFFCNPLPHPKIFGYQRTFTLDKNKQMKPNIGITEKNREAVSEYLNKLLADEHVLYIQTRNAHWNVEGRDFHAQHIFFEKLYTEIGEIIDEVAERVRSIGHYALGSMSEFLKLTHLSEKKPAKNDSLSYMKEMLESHEQIIMHMRENVDKIADEWNDQGTSDFVTGLMEQHEKMARMLRAHLN